MNKPAIPTCYSSATGAATLDTDTRDLSTNLGEIIRFAITRSDCLATAASTLGVTSKDLIKLARQHKIRLPWSRASRRIPCG